MGLAFCSACNQHVYVDERANDACPACSSSLAETEETITARVGV